MELVMYMNGPKAGQIIEIQDPQIGSKLVIATMRNTCEHQKDISYGNSYVTYTISQSESGMNWFAYTDAEFDDWGYFCPTCKAESEAKWKIKLIRDMTNELLGEDEE